VLFWFSNEKNEFLSRENFMTNISFQTNTFSCKWWIPKNKIEQKINFSSISRSGDFSGNYDDRLDYHHGLRRWECSIWRGPLISVLREVESVLNVKKSFLKVYLVFFLSNSSVLVSFYNSTSYVCDIKSGVVPFQGGNICGLIVHSSVESRIIELLFKHCKFVMLRIGEFIIPIW
jgi:hypothetical protein